jgi:hypothetical protein
MDWCFKAEKEKKRKTNADRGRALREKFEKAKTEQRGDE